MIFSRRIQRELERIGDIRSPMRIRKRLLSCEVFTAEGRSSIPLIIQSVCTKFLIFRSLIPTQLELEHRPLVLLIVSLDVNPPLPRLTRNGTAFLQCNVPLNTTLI